MTSMTAEQKTHIDSLEYEDLLRGVRFAPIGDPMFQGETGAYWMAQLKAKRPSDAEAAGISKRIGWDR